MPRSPLRDRVFLPALALAPLMVLVWLAGPHWGLAAPAARLGWILLLGLLWLVLAASGVRARRRAGAPTPAGPDPGGPDPDRPDPAAPLREGMARALSALRGSRPGRRQRLALPWHLVLGAPGVGKTSLLERSGLRFTLPSEPPPGPDGAGCRWHFATEGVLLEAPGSFAEPGADAGGWPELVRLLKARRRRAPLDGVILAMPLEELAGPCAAERGRRFRQRLGDLERSFGRRVPAYLVVTRLDRLRGFAAFCAGLPEQAAEPAWGAMLHEPGDRRRGARPRPGLDLPGLAAARFDELGLGLEQAVADHLGRRPGGDPDLAAFPLEFRALGQGLLAFVQAMDAADPYHPRPCLRGFWFTSARPAPGPAAATAARVAARFALPDPAGPEPAPVPDRTWFLDGLWREAILPDRHPAGRRQSARRPWIQAAVLAGGLAALALLAVAWLGSLAGNRDLLRDTLADLREARDLAAGPGPEDRLRGLQVLQARLDRLAAPPSPALGWGLYQGGPAERAVRAHYGADLSRVLLEPVRTQLEAALAAPSRPVRPGPAEDPAYATLRTYLLLGRRNRLDPDHLAGHLPRWWHPWLRLRAGGALSPELARLAETTLTFYLDQRGRPDLPVIAVRPDLVAAVRARLGGRRRPTLERRYGDLKAKAASRFEPLTLARILGREDPDLRAAAGPVPGWFTRAAWEGQVREAIEAAAEAPGAADADWVLEEPGDGPAPEAVRAALTARYKAEYAEAWRRFLDGLEVRPWSGPGEAATALGRLADPEASALKQVLARTAQETGWDNPTALDRTLRTARTRMLAGTGRLLGAGPASGPERPATPGPLGAPFALAAWLAPPQGTAALDGFLERLRKVQARLQAVASGGDPEGASRQWLQATHQGAGELAESQAWLDTTPGDPAGWAALRPLLQRPLVQAYGALLPGAEQDLERAWAREVHGPWQALAGAYPFADAEPDAPFAELARFLQPGSGILARFLDTRLAGLVTLRDDGYAARPWAGRGPGFTRAFLDGISRLEAAAAALGDGGPAHFELRPEPCPGLAEIDLEIDGQRLQYRNGPQVWTAFVWPGPGPGPGARIHTVSLEGTAAGTLGAPGPMGLARLLAQSRTERPEAGAAALEWRLPGPAPARTGGHALRFTYRRVSGADPLRLAALRGLTLPARICR